MRPDKNIINAMKSVRFNASAKLDNRVHSGIDQALAQSQQTLKVHAEPHGRRILMRSPMIKIAAAAVIAVVAIPSILMLAGGKPAFAKVIKPILEARTFVYDFVVGDESTGTLIHDEVSGSRIRRTFSNMPTILILDLQQGKMLTLDPGSKTAVNLDIQGPLVEGTRNLMKLVQNIVADIADHPEQVQDLGRREIDGASTVGYQIKEPNIKLNIWASTATATPVRIELYERQSVTVLRNIQFDVPVDEVSISTDLPAGYTLQKTDMASMGTLTEQDFVESLRIWAQMLNNGVFPDVLSTAAMMKELPQFADKLRGMNLSADEGTKLGINFGKGFGFLEILGHEGEWHYAGKGVAFGDAKTAVFWYRKGDAKTYRVIYGDLHVEDVDLDRMPK
jgi:hypothetical protein